MIIRNNIPALNAQRNIKVVGGKKAKASERLSSGYRINSAADDAAGLAISEKMRAQIRGLDQAAHNAEDAINLIQTADGALNDVDEIIIRMRELAIQSANDTNNSDDREKIDQEIQALKDEIDAISTRTEYNNKKLLDGTYAAEYTVMNPGGPVSIGNTFGDVGITDANFPTINYTPPSPPADDRYTIPVNSGSDDIYFYQADPATNKYRVTYNNAGTEYEGNFLESELLSGQITLIQTSNITSTPPNEITLDLDPPTIKQKVLTNYLDTGEFPYVNVPVRTHAASVNFDSNYAGATANLTRWGGVQPNAEYSSDIDNLGITVGDITLNDFETNQRYGIGLQGYYDRWTVPKSKLDEMISFTNTGIDNVNLVQRNWSYPPTSHGTPPNNYTDQYSYSITNNSPSFYISENAGGNLEYKMSYIYNQTRTVTPETEGNTGHSYDYWGTSTGVLNGNTVEFYGGNSNEILLFSFEITSAGQTNMRNTLPSYSDFNMGAYCFSGTMPGGTGALASVDSATASYPEHSFGSGYKNTPATTYDPSIIFQSGGNVNFTYADDGTIVASLNLTILDDNKQPIQSNFTTTVNENDTLIRLENPDGQWIEFNIGSYDDLVAILTWGNVNGSGDDASTKYSMGFNLPQNYVDVTRQSDGSFLFNLMNAESGTVMMSGTCAADAGAVTLNDSSYGNLGESMTLNFATAGFDTLENYLRDDHTGGNDSYSFSLNIDTVNDTADATYNRGNNRTQITYPTTDLSGNAIPNPIGNLKLSCDIDDVNYAWSSPFDVAVQNIGNGEYKITVNAGDGGPFSWEGGSDALPAGTITLVNPDNGRQLTLSGMEGLNDYVAFYGDTLQGTISFDINAPWIDVNYDVTAFQNPYTETETGQSLYFQTGANSGQGMLMHIGSVSTNALGAPITVSEVNVKTVEDSTEALEILDSALTDVVSIRANLGACQNRLEYTKNSLKVSSVNLSAAESRIRDADMAKEMMEFTKGNVLQQAVISMLAQANQSPEMVLQLLG